MQSGQILMAALVAVVMPRPQEANISFVSDRIAIRSVGEGSEQLEMYDTAGGLIRSVSLGDRDPIAGIGGVALVGDPANGTRPVVFLDTSGGPDQLFSIAADRQLVVGRESLALIPQALHRVGTAFSIHFSSFGGAPLLMQVIPEAVLVKVEAAAGGHFLAHSIETGMHVVRVYDSQGQLLWSFGSPLGSPPQVSVAPSGSRAVAWTIAEDRITSSVHLLDGQGNDVIQLTVDAVHSAVFSQDESALVLAGWDAIIVIDALTNKITWTSNAPLSQPTGTALAVSVDGRLVDLITQPDAGAIHPGLRTIRRSAGSAEIEVTFRELAQIPIPRRVLGLSQLEDGDVRIVTTAGQWRIAR